MDINFGTKLTRKRITVAKMINNWWDLKNSDWRATTTNNYSVSKRFWIERFGDLYADGITPTMIEEAIIFLKNHGMKHVTKKKQIPNAEGAIWEKVRFLKKVYQMAVGAGSLDASPFIGKGGVKVESLIVPIPKTERDRYFLEEERSLLFKTLNEPEWRWLKDYTIVASQTGLRRINMCGMKWSHINWTEKTVSFNSSEMKSKKPFKISLSDLSIKILNQRHADFGNCFDYVFLYNDGKPITDKRNRMARLSNAWAKLMKRVGIKNFRLHDLRHDFASFLVQQNVSIYQTMVLMGHSKVSMTQRYAKLAPSQSPKALQVFSGIEYENADTKNDSGEKILPLKSGFNKETSRSRGSKKSATSVGLKQ